VQQVSPTDSHEVVETRVRTAIQDYFKFRLSRPEILNRIGDNIIVFGFITPEIGAQIFDGHASQRDQAACATSTRSDLVLDAGVREKLRDLCTADLSNGGRGIGNQLESAFVNPLARAMFRFRSQGRRSVT
jgi:ATP-dependent Clp protease ATP-binding subunit ClpA